MNEEIKALWLSALRSGLYEQGRAYLKRTEEGAQTPTYCCLGVLCDLAVKAGAIEEPKVHHQYGKVYTYGHEADDSSVNTLPPAVMEWSGMPTRGGDLPEVSGVDYATYGSLWRMNDIAKMDFQEIADVIEENF